jgi:integrase
MLARIVAALPENLTAIRDRALLLVGFFCALRRSELVALAVEDLDRQSDGWIITIQRSKTDPYGRGQHVPGTSMSDGCRRGLAGNRRDC